MERNKSNIQIEELCSEIARLKKVNAALIGRVERSISNETGAFALFEGNILLSNQVKERTEELEKLTQQITMEKNKIYRVIQALPGLIVMFNSHFEVIEFFEGKSGADLNQSKHSNITEMFNPEFYDKVLDAYSSLEHLTEAAYFDFSSEEDERRYRCTLSRINEDQFLLYIQDETEKAIKDHVIQAQKAQIIQASKLSALGEMAGGIAHEINTPLGTINLLASQIESLLTKPELDVARTISMAQKIQHTVRKMSVMVKSLRQISRDGSEEPMESCRLSQLVDEVLDLCRERFSLSGVTLKVSIPQDIVIMAKKVQLAQVILNLLNNSFYVAASCKDGWVHVECVDMNDKVRFLLTDCGTGIDPKILERVFDPFFTTKEIGEGTGLGMSISQQIIKEHGSHITYKLHKGHTCFYFDLIRADGSVRVA